MNRPEGGHAFPRPGDGRFSASDGMSLRDYFAAQALPHCIRASEHDGAYDEVAAAVAAYHYADAMIAQRGK